MKGNDIVRVVAKLLLPLILLFALYVQFHGDFGPGGGFQAGVIFAVAIVIYALVFGLEEAHAWFPQRAAEVLSAGGVLIYGGTGVISMLAGSPFLDYNALASDPVHGQHYGILAVELGVGVTVTATMVLLFYCFADRLQVRRDAEMRQP